MNELGPLSFVMQMSVKWVNGGVELCQQRHITDLKSKFNMENAKPRGNPIDPKLQLDKDADPISSIPYRSLIGGLLWIARGTRPDIMFAVIYLAQFCNCYTDVHFGHAKRVLRYLQATSHYVLRLAPKKGKVNVRLFSDSDWAADKNDRRSISGSLSFINGALVDWCSTKQASVATSSTEAEYVAVSETAKTGIHLKQLLSEVGADLELPIKVDMDNQGALFMGKHDVNNKRSRHIDIRYHLIRDWIQKQLISLRYLATDFNIADLLTKGLDVNKTVQHRTSMGVVEPSG